MFGLSTHINNLAYRDFELVDRSVIAEKMISYWKNELGVSEKTTKDWLAAALNFDRFVYDVDQIKQRFGDLSGKRVADIGCGWGSFLLMLQREGALLEACDLAQIHVEVAQMRVPDARVVRADARDLSALAPESFDFVLEHDVFEHIGDYSGDTGPLGKTYDDKLANLRELRRLMKPGGKGFLSTGNFQFPYNGEVHLWFLHWFPFTQQQRYLDSLGLDSDRYWLCTWEQMTRLFDEAELRIEEVFTPPHDVESLVATIRHLMRDDPRSNDVFGDILKELMNTKPEFMPSWMIFFSKK
jgi:2-polyprenyl-3-methyl-5-hydroxy-6-metoxy-1,4-benzoquinol methylase